MLSGVVAVVTTQTVEAVAVDMLDVVECVLDTDRCR